VLVFTASNFPFAFSVAGGDTAAALAAGCPVVVKAHPGHPGLSARVAALGAEAGAPLWLVHGVDAGRDALADPRIKAAAFTGSTAGGRALLDVAHTRPDPIPFYGELGSVNPVFVSPRAVAARGMQIVDEFVASFTLGVGQFCTKPGLLFAPAGHGLAGTLVDKVRSIDAAPMLGPWVEDRYLSTLAERGGHDALSTLHAGRGTAPTLLAARLDDIAGDVDLLGEECFGPAAIVIDYGDDGDILRVADAIEGGLTATVHAEPDEEAWTRPLLDILQTRAGRIVFNGWPTGVAVSPAMHHGGPWPATTWPLFSSVGGNSISRFLRPVCFQNVPDPLLPPALQDANPLGIRRRIDGVVR
jgi:NADP-dependent aldehyde dehydrogenase